MRPIFRRAGGLPEGVRTLLGLGNPGRRYARTRHNLGFRVADAVAERLGGRFAHSGYGCRFALCDLDGSPLLLAKPTTYMNRSGEAARSLLVGLGVEPRSMLVVCDDVDLPLGRIRIRGSGGPGTHNGLRSVVDLLGTQDFPRLRLGIGVKEAPEDLAEFVLSPFEPEEVPVVEEMVKRASEAALCFFREGLETAMNRFNGGGP